MCNGFGALIDKTGAIYFIEPDKSGDISHSEIIKRLGWQDNVDVHLRNFIRVECSDWTMDAFRVDEVPTLPGWVDLQDVKDLTEKTLSKCAPALAEYKKVRDPALAEYQKVRAPAWAEYQKVHAPALAEYEKVHAPAWAEYQRVRDPAWAEYQKVRDTAWAEYEKVRDTALAEYQKVRDTAWAKLITRLSKIKGYVPGAK